MKQQKLTYTSEKDRFMSLFNPPKGSNLSYIDYLGIQKNNSIVTFQIPKENFKSVDKITMRFSTNKDAENDRNFIFLDISEPSIKSLLGA